jgi:hypothetical protein
VRISGHERRQPIAAAGERQQTQPPRQRQAGACRPQLFDAAVIQSISNLDASHGMIERC